MRFEVEKNIWKYFEFQMKIYHKISRSTFKGSVFYFKGIYDVTTIFEKAATRV